MALHAPELHQVHNAKAVLANDNHRLQLGCRQELRRSSRASLCVQQLQHPATAAAPVMSAAASGSSSSSSCSIDVPSCW